MNINALWKRLGVAPAYTTALVAALAVLLAGTVGFSLLAQAVQRQATDDYRSRINRQTAALSVHTDSAVRSYNRLLLAAAASLNQQPQLSATTWQQLYQDMKVPKEYPELLGFGYATYHSELGRSDFEQTMRSELSTDFTVRPMQGQGEFVTITYLQPMDTFNTKALGYDMNSEVTRRQAILAARDGASVTMTAPVHLVQDEGTERKDRYGVLLYYPVYSSRTTPATVAERREQLKGFVYLVLRPDDLVQHYIDTAPQFASGIAISIKDSLSGKELYKLDNNSSGVTQTISEDKELRLDGRSWLFHIAGQESFVTRSGSPIIIVGLGLFASLATSYITFRYLLSRVRNIEAAYEKEVQRSKEELLALASHQLRTPASGVKQYLGLLHGGFVGELTAQQQEVTAKALEANERQLNIINELLYVSKIDAGQLQLEPREVDMTQLVNSVVEGFSEQAQVKDIELRCMTKKVYTAWVDDRYIRMIVENLVSNALKYSHSDTVVKVALRRADDMLELSVADKGVGLAASDLERVFQKFERVSNELSRSEGGSGLGLFLAKELALAHGGDITVASEPGQGSTFTLCLPIKKESLRESKKS